MSSEEIQVTEKNRAGKGHPDDAALQEKRRLAGEIIERLEKEYPDAGCTLDYDDAWKLLVSVRLAAQCTDARVNVVVEKLYEKFPDVEALAAADPEEIEELVRPCGLGKSKARDIKACMTMLRDEYDCKVPDDFNKLLKLPGVGRKSANVIMLEAFNMPQGIAVDTHCKRIANRLGFSKETEPSKIEQDLLKVIPKEYYKDVNHIFIWHGRNLCTSQNPKCDKCPLKNYCKFH